MNLPALLVLDMAGSIETFMLLCQTNLLKSHVRRQLQRTITEMNADWLVLLANGGYSFVHVYN